MKPFNYIWAFTHGQLGPGTGVVDSPITLPDPGNQEDGGWYSPINYDHMFHGALTVRQALDNSINIPAVKVEYYITHPDRVARTAFRFGMKSLYKDNPGIGCSVCYAVTLGGLARGTRPLEETAAYGVFATGGWTVPPVAIWKVVKRSTGKVLYCSSQCPRGVQPDPTLARTRQQVVDAGHAYEMSDILSDDNARCTPQVCEFGLNSVLKLSRPAAAKTGTTNDWTDNWTVGYTPQIVTGVWVGNADRSPMIDVNGITGAAPIWHDFMENAFSILRLPAVWYVPPADVLRTDQCVDSSSHTVRFGASDIYVATGSPGQASSLPICNLPDRGSMPVGCNQYPSTFPSPLQCPSTLPYTYPYRYTYPNQQYPYPNGLRTQPNSLNGAPQGPSLPQPTLPNSGPPTVR
jgi:membrane peptidoglycan carboxypeptidase